MATFDFLNLGGSVSPPPPTVSPRSTSPGSQSQGPPRPTGRPQRQRSQSSDEDEEEYQRELHHKKSGLRRKKKPIATEEADEEKERTRAEDRRDEDAGDEYGSVRFIECDVGAEDESGSVNKTSWVEEQLALREDEYTTEKSIRIFCGTWNVNAKKRHHEADISAWILPPDEEEDDTNAEEGAEAADRTVTPADVYCIGFQEIVDLNAASLVVDHSASVPWDQFILATLHKTGKPYTQIASVHLVGLSLSVFVKERLATSVTDVRTGTVGTGIMGVGGNKGAVLARFELFKSSICVINTHLAAHQKKVSARNRDYANILKRALLLPAAGSNVRKKKIYTDTTNKLKLQPWNEGVVLDEDEEEEDDLEEEEVSTVNAAAPNTATTAGQIQAGKEQQAAAAPSTAAVTKQSSSQSINASGGGKELNVSSMKKMMFAGLSQLRKGVSNAIQTVSNELEHMQGPTEEMIKEGFRIYEADHIFWIGDLNYRLNVNSMQEVHDLIDDGRWRKLLTKDQLHIEKARGHAFVGFEEGRIRFPPTYKYKTNTNEYDKDVKKARYPAYCDRIQWCSNDSNFEQLYYRRAGKLKASDHKPVMALFDVPIKKDIISKKKRLRQHLEALTEDARACQPRIAVDSQMIDIGDVRFEVPVVKRLIVKNVGNSVVVFRCESAGKRKSKGEGAVNLLLPWLNIDPLEGVVHPGHVVELNITLFVDRNYAFLLNTEEESIATPVVLRLTTRNAAEIAVRGRYMKSCLGSDLTFLMSLTAPIRSNPASPINDGRQSTKDSRPAVPYEIYRLVDHIIKAGGTVSKGTFYPPALVPIEEGGGLGSSKYAQIESTPQVRYLCEQLDTGRAFDQPATATTPAIKLPTHFFVQALLYFLHSLRKPLFFKRGRSSLASPSPASHSSAAAAASSATSSRSNGSLAAPASSSSHFNLTSWCYQSLMDLPSEHYRTFTFVCAFLREVLKHEDKHGLGPEELATCVAGSIMHRMPDEAYSDKVQQTPIQIMVHFLTEKEFTK